MIYYGKISQLTTCITLSHDPDARQSDRRVVHLHWLGVFTSRFGKKYIGDICAN